MHEGLDMLVKFGYCINCDNGPDRKNREWVEDLVKTQNINTPIMQHCSSCKEQPTNKNLLVLEVKLMGL